VRREISSPWLIDGVNEVQVRDRRHVAPAELIARLVAAAPGATRTRARLPRPVRAVPVVFPPPIGRRSVAYLVDLVITRDVWMHRVDIARAAGTDLVLTPEHDGRIVADIVADWAATHVDQFLLELTGPAGGAFRRGRADPVTVEAVDFVRIVSGRAVGEGVLAYPLPL
jgi:Mycothiol maleylpyruvate isomerase N-terminal domain